MEKKRNRGFQSTQEAREGRARGHRIAREFAHCIGLADDYQNDQKAKKDVIDPSGDAHSLKSGKKKWQIFLYSHSRFENDVGFTRLNGLGEYLRKLIEAFPETFEKYSADKISAKLKLQEAQRELSNKLQDKELLKAFLSKSFFNGNEVNYLTIYGETDKKYHVFKNTDILDILSKNLEVSNSKARNKNQMDALKTIFLFNGKNFAEVEVRTEHNHYREIRFNMYSQLAINLFYKIDLEPNLCFSDNVLVYGQAKKKFPNWLKSK